MSDQGVFGAWQPIETAPMDGTVVMLGERAGFIGPMFYAGHFERFPHKPEGCWLDTFDAINPKPTHWMPIPDLPK